MVNDTKEDDISIEEYEKKFLKEYQKQQKENLYVRRCGTCGYFMTSDSIDDKNCPQCHGVMHFALYCSKCATWYSVKTHKKYVCPSCGELLQKKESI